MMVKNLSQSRPITFYCLYYNCFLLKQLGQEFGYGANRGSDWINLPYATPIQEYSLSGLV